MSDGYLGSNHGLELSCHLKHLLPNCHTACCLFHKGTLGVSTSGSCSLHAPTSHSILTSLLGYVTPAGTVLWQMVPSQWSPEGVLRLAVHIPQRVGSMAASCSIAVAALAGEQLGWVDLPSKPHEHSSRETQLTRGSG